MAFQRATRGPFASPGVLPGTLELSPGPPHTLYLRSPVKKSPSAVPHLETSFRRQFSKSSPSSELWSRRKKALASPPNKRQQLTPRASRKNHDQWARIIQQRDSLEAKRDEERGRRKIENRTKLVSELDHQIEQRHLARQEAEQQKKRDLEWVRSREAQEAKEIERERQVKMNRQAVLRQEIARYAKTKEQLTKEILLRERDQELALLRLEDRKAQEEQQRRQQNREIQRQRYQELLDDNAKFLQAQSMERQNKKDAEMAIMKEYLRREEEKDKKRKADFQKRLRVINGREAEGARIVEQRKIEQQRQEQLLQRQMREHDLMLERKEQERRRRARQVALDAMRGNEEQIRMKESAMYEWRLREKERRREIENHILQENETMARKAQEERQAKLSYGAELKIQMRSDKQRADPSWLMSDYEKKVNRMHLDQQTIKGGKNNHNQHGHHSAAFQKAANEMSFR